MIWIQNAASVGLLGYGYYIFMTGTDSAVIILIIAVVVCIPELIVNFSLAYLMLEADTQTNIATNDLMTTPQYFIIGSNDFKFPEQRG